MTDAEFIDLSREQAIQHLNTLPQSEAIKLRANWEAMHGPLSAGAAGGAASSAAAMGKPPLGYALVVIGVALIFLGWVFDPSVETGGGLYDLPDRIINTGQLATKQMIFFSGALLMIVGAITVAADRIVAAIETLTSKS